MVLVFCLLLRCSNNKLKNFKSEVKQRIKDLADKNYQNASDIYQPDFERIICFKLEHLDELLDVRNKVLIIENSAFAECRALGNVMFPDTLRLVEAYAFYGCGAEKFHLDWNLYFLGISVFSDCQNLTTFESDLDIIYTGSGSFEVDKDGVLFENGNGNATRKLLCYPAGKTDEKYTIP